MDLSELRITGTSDHRTKPSDHDPGSCFPMKAFIQSLLCGGFLIMMPGCLLPPFQAELDTNLGEDALTLIEEKKKCEYRIRLDQPSSAYTVTKYQDNYVGDKQPYTFPLGATLSSFLRQAQQGHKGDLFSLHFDTSNFHFVLGELYIAGVNSVTYIANFTGPPSIGTFSFPTSYIFPPGLAEEIDFPEKTFFAISQALRLSTIKLFEEMTARVCYR